MALYNLIDSLIRSLSGNLSVPTISQIISNNLTSYQGGKRLQSTFAKLLLNYKSNKHYGRLASGLLMALLTEGLKFIDKLEATGLLLCGEHVEKNFYVMLKRLQNSFKDGSNGDNWCERRIETYLNYCNFVMQNEKNISNLKNILRNRSDSLIKGLLGLTELYFIIRYFDLEIDLPMLAKIKLISRTPEEFASITSHLIWMANNVKPLKEEEFQTAIDGEMGSQNMERVIEGGEVLNCISNVGKAISIFGYSLEMTCGSERMIYKVIPPSKDFEYFLRLGHVREEIMRPVDRIHAYNWANRPLLSMNVATKFLIGKKEDFFTKWLEKPFPRVTLLMHFDPKEDMYKTILKEQLYVEDVYHSQIIHDEYLIAESGEGVFIDDVLDLNNFMETYRHFVFFNYMDLNAIILHRQKYNKFSMNSFVRVAVSTEYIENMSQLFFIDKKQIESFLQLITWDTNNDFYCDLQYQPLIRVNRLVVMLPALFIISNIFRNVQVSNKIRVKQQGAKFTLLCRTLLARHFPKVTSEKRLKDRQKGLETEVDVIAWLGDTLYLFECKYSLPSCNYQEMRGLWDDILKGVEQLNIVKEILSDPGKRQSYLTGWFPGTTRSDTVNLEIKTCVISSHRMFSGMNIDDVPIRDYYSFQAIMAEHAMSHGVIEPEKENILIQYSTVGPGGFSKVDIDDFLGKEPRYFKMFSEDMLPVTHFQSLIGNRLIVAWETFLYSHRDNKNMEAYIERMGRLGFHRLPDKTMVVHFPMPVEDFDESIKKEKYQT